jgi:anti-sigma factor RsiW
MTQDQLDLLHSYLNGTLDEADFARLQSLLRENTDARRTLRSLSTVETKLTQLAAIHPETVRLLSETARESAPSFRWFSWRPLTAAAAGLAIGLFSASMVFGFSVRSLEKVVSLLQESFESGPAPLVTGNLPAAPIFRELSPRPWLRKVTTRALLPPLSGLLRLVSRGVTNSS